MLRLILAYCITAFLCTNTYAAVTVSVNGSNHTIPQTNEKGWGTNVTAWIQAISQYTLQPSGGTFTLTAEVNTGATYGFKVPYIKTATATPSTAGVLRLARTDGIGWRNQADGANLLLEVDSSNRLTFNSVILPTATAASVQDSTFSIYDNSDPTKLVAFQVSGVTAGQTRTLTVPDFSGTIATLAGTEALTNKTLTGNTAVNLISGSGTLVLNTSGTVTLPNATATLVGLDTTDVLTNKSIDEDGTGNAITNLANASIKAGAAIDATKIADGSVTSTEFQYIGGLTSDAQTQINSATTSSSNPYKISNCSIAASVGSSALTVALKDAAGSDPSGGSPCTISFRNATLTTGTYADVVASAATSVVVSNGSSLGCTVSATCYISVYAINNAGTIELGVVFNRSLDEGGVHTSTAEGGAGGADTISTLYSTTARTDKAVRLLGRVIVIPAGSFAWTNSPAAITNTPFNQPRTRAWSGYHDSTCSWARTNTSFGEPTADSTCALQERTNTNFGTVTTKTNVNPVPGLVLDLQEPGTYKVCLSVSMFGPASAAATIAWQLLDNAGTAIVRVGEQTPGTAQEVHNNSGCGLFFSAAAGAYTLSLQTRASTGAITILATTSAEDGISWTLEKVN